MTSSSVWTVIVWMAIGTFCLRFSFLGLIGNRELPGWVLRVLRYTPVAVIPGLMAPQIFLPSAGDTAADPAKLAAVAVTLIIGLWAKNTIAAMAGGIGTLAMLTWLLP